jgi:hypothetical protein
LVIAEFVGKRKWLSVALKYLTTFNLLPMLNLMRVIGPVVTRARRRNSLSRRAFSSWQLEGLTGSVCISDDGERTQVFQSSTGA